MYRPAEPAQVKPLMQMPRPGVFMTQRLMWVSGVVEVDPGAYGARRMLNAVEAVDGRTVLSASG